MAPKKKKKPAVNPARGFATTSIPSKSKVSAGPDGEDAEAAAADDSGRSQAAMSGAPVPAADTDKTTNLKDNKDIAGGLRIQDMTPGELEAHLENSELDAMLEKYAAKSLADVHRQVARLETERRQLRPQTQKLSTYTWLPDETLQELFEMDHDDRQEAVYTSSRAALTSVDEEKLTVDLWTLERVLLSLGFPRVSEATAFIAELAVQGQLRLSVDSLPGLPEALQWYASHSEPVELGNYEHASSAKAEQSGESTPAHMRSEPTTATQSRQSPASTPAKVSEAEEDSLSSSDSDEEDDPAKMTERYIQLQRQLWYAQNPEVSIGAETTAPKGRRLDRLTRKLQQIRRDPLFEEREADFIWSTNLLELQEIIQQGLRTAATSRRRGKENSGQKIPEGDGDVHKFSHEVPHGDEEAEVLFGDMFGQSEDALSSDQNQSISEGSVKLLDFGKWSGLSPRRLLEELCRGRDLKARLRLQSLTQTSYSARHRLEISWVGSTTPAAHALDALPLGVPAQVTDYSWHLEMKDVAAASTAQSEAYVCTLTLFLLSTLGASELRATSRLPTVWRDLIRDLADAKQKLVNEENKSTLRRLRGLLHETQNRISQQQFQSDSVERAITATVTARRRTRPQASLRMTPEEVFREWSNRTARSSFQQMLEVRQELPVHRYKDMILACIAENPVSVICAETGAGKSSGIPVLLLEQEFAGGRDCRILVTQPRRISAITLARRVSQELGEGRNDIGTIRSLVGYAIRMESKASSTTRITYATTGVLLRMLEDSPDLEELDVLVLDEVHERTMDLELLFIALQKLQKRRSALKIVLMSATVDAKKFSEYFGGAPVLDLPGRTFPVEVGFLEDAVEATNNLSSVKDNTLVLQDEDQDIDDTHANDKGRPVVTEPEKYSSQTLRTIANMDEYRIDYNLIARLAAAVATKPEYVKYSAAILIFMPGIGEIRRLHSLLVSIETFSRNWIVHLLHSTFSTEDLERAFERPPRGHRKIVIATNIAETGITIPDVTAVIDTCKEKIMRFDERRQLSRLNEGFISRSSARQRRGRAARVQDGLCFHLVTKHRFENQMLEQQVPEMLRLSLQDPMLRIKVWDLGSIEDTLSAAIDPPSRKNILRAVEKLKDAGALTKSEALTPLGQQIARLPLEVSLAKLAIFGVIFKCLGPVLAIISLLTSKSPFLSTTQGSQDDARHVFKRGDADLLSSLNAYESWKRAKASRTASEFCRKYHVSDQTMSQIAEQEIQLLVYLVDAGLVVLDSEERTALNRARTRHSNAVPSHIMPSRYNQTIADRALLAIVAMALYPRILMREGKGWRNVYTNQMVSLTSRSINHHSHSTKQPRWLSFFEAMQNTRSGNLNVFETSAIPESALAILLGSDAEFKFYAGVMVLDGGKIKLSVREWRQLIAIKILRERIEKVLGRCYSHPGKEMSDQDRKWLDFWLKIEAAQETGGVDFVQTLRHDTYPAISTSKADLSEKIVVVTGSSRGIGKATALSYAKAGASGIVILARSDLSSLEDEISKAAKDAGRAAPKVLSLSIDVTDRAAVEKAASHVTEVFGKVDVLINNAGYMATHENIDCSDPQEWWKTWEVNVKGVYLMSKFFLPLLLKSELKTVVVVSSIGALLTRPGMSAYQITKTAELRLNNFLMAEYGEQGLLAYAVHPGLVLTELSSQGPKWTHEVLTDPPRLASDTLVWLTRERREWLADRYISVNWDMDELLAKEDEIQPIPTNPFSTFTPILSKASNRLPPRPTLPDSEIKEVYVKGTGPGGQAINKTNSAAQLTHIPTGIVVKSQATRSRSQNYTIARRLLAEKVELLQKGDDSRVVKVLERKSKKKRSADKKKRRKYRELAGEKDGQEEALDQDDNDEVGDGAEGMESSDLNPENTNNDATTPKG
ncbi:hypothetical protein H2200_003784 [Cladophialophora chaetospira]|uniref:RNA helicase n=1 Tax=Cladophialophora chaetospira TaxID=386627 RepID=A0AA39CL24_9EURO|nr:hypothetical protein H2200_003784 [Cladophialophora chaetospira]